MIFPLIGIIVHCSFHINKLTCYEILQNIAETLLFISNLVNIILIGFCKIPLMLNVLLMTGPIVCFIEVPKTAPRHQRESPSQLKPKGCHER